MCSWRRALKLRCQLTKVLDEVFADEPRSRLLMLSVTQPTVEGADFGEAINRLQRGPARLMSYKRVRAAVRHWFPSMDARRLMGGGLIA
jgi:hypothetical protein